MKQKTGVNYLTFRFPTAASRRKAEKSRHSERAQIRVSVQATTAQAIAGRDRLNSASYRVRQYQVTDAGDGFSVVTAGGIRVRVK